MKKIILFLILILLACQSSSRADYITTPYKYTNGVYTTGANEGNYVEEPVIFTPDMSPGGVWKMWLHTVHVIDSETWYDTITYYTSSDGISWTRVSELSFDDTGTNANHYAPTLIYKAGDARPYWLYCNNDDARGYIGLYTSTDGVNFTVDTALVLAKGNPGTWDQGGATNPYVWIEGSTWYMIYCGGDAMGWWQGFATSSNGRTWTKDAQNPIEVTGFNQGNNSVYGGRAVKLVGDTYYYLFHGKTDATSGQFPSEIYMAYSASTGSTISKLRGPWTVVNGGNPFIARVQDWEGVGQSVGQVADPWMVEYAGKTYIYYEGIKEQFAAGGTQTAFRIGLVLIPTTFVNYLFPPPISNLGQGGAISGIGQGGKVTVH